MGELMGWSWLFPPFLWAFGAVAASPVETLEFDARMVRAWCACDPALSYEVTRRVAEVLTRRMKSTRSRLVTVSLHPAPARS
jgi:CRP-like cAMP-binding protein